MKSIFYPRNIEEIRTLVICYRIDIRNAQHSVQRTLRQWAREILSLCGLRR